jgi:hypothetical protein
MVNMHGSKLLVELAAGNSFPGLGDLDFLKCELCCG